MICDPISDYVAGVFVSTWRFAELLKAKGHTVIFIAAASPEHPEDGVDSGFMMYRFRSVPLPKSEGAWRIILPRPKYLKDIFKKERIDIVHLLIPTPSSMIAGRVAREMHIPVVAHSHAQPENTFMHVPIKALRSPLNASFDRYMGLIYKSADYLIFPTEFARECLKKHLNGKKQAVITNGVHTDMFVPKRDMEFRAQHSTSESAYVVLYVGRLHPEKNVETLIKAFPKVVAKNANAVLWIVGAGHMEGEMKELAKEIDVADAVRFTGKVSDADLLRSYHAADVFVLPSLAELEGMVVLEAMSSGLPIIIADAEQSASRFFVQDNGSLFSPFDTDALAGAILKYADVTERERAGAKSRELALGFDIHQSVNKLQEVYYSLV